MDKALRSRLAIALFILPPLILYLGIIVVPIAWTFVYSLFSGMPGLKFEFNGLNNYVKMWNDKQFLTALVMNLKYVLFVVIGQVGIGLMLSLMFHFAIKRFKTFVRTIIFFPVVLPVVAVAQLFAKAFEITPQYGLFNALMELMNITSLIQPWLGQGKTAFLILCIMDTWTAMGFYAVIFYGALVDIPDDIIEAARIDGANGGRLFRHILMPLLKPITITSLLFSLSGTLKVFESPTALTKGGPGTATTSLSMFMYNTAFTYSEYGYGSAIAIFIFAECIFAAIVVNQISKRSLQLGARRLRQKGGRL